MLTNGQRKNQSDKAARDCRDCVRLKALREARRVALSCGTVSLGPLAALVAFHLRTQFVERPRTESGYLLPDYLERHPDRALAALTSDPRMSDNSETLILRSTVIGDIADQLPDL